MADSSTITSPTNSARSVAGLMGFTVVFALLGHEIDVANGGSKDKLANGVSTGGVIIIGGLIAAALLTALTGAGEAGRKFAVGLAGVSAATATLVYGKPVWDGISNIVGGKPTAPLGSTGNTAPTKGTASAVALAQVA
jgi:hypothetical protein